MVQHMSLQHGFEPVVLKSWLATAGLENIRRSPKDGIHPNEHGHRLIAEALVPALATKLGEGSTRSGTDDAGVSP
jgi:lysophospholipase L1-like esterase